MKRQRRRWLIDPEAYPEMVRALEDFGTERGTARGELLATLDRITDHGHVPGGDPSGGNVVPNSICAAPPPHPVIFIYWVETERRSLVLLHVTTVPWDDIPASSFPLGPMLPGPPAALALAQSRLERGLY